MKKLNIILWISLSLLPTLSYAQNDKFFGVGTGQATLSTQINATKDNPASHVEVQRSEFWNIYSGLKLTDNFSAKAEFLTLGRGSAFSSDGKSQVNFDMKAISLSGQGFYPLNNHWSVLGEGGAYVYRTKENYMNAVDSQQAISHGTKAFWGLGVRYAAGKNTNIILKYDDYGKIHNEYTSSHAQHVALNVEYRF